MEVGHPAVGYLVAVPLQAITVTGLVGLVRLFPSFQFQEAVVILVVLVVAFTWGAGPSPVATVVGGMQLVLLLLPPVFSLTITRIEDVLDLLVYLCVGCAVSLLTSQAQRARHAAERVRRRLDSIQQTMTDAVLVYDGEGRLVLWNVAAEQLRPPGQTHDASRILPARDERLLLLDEQGQPLPFEQQPIRRILGGEALTGNHAVDVLMRLADGRDTLMNFSEAPIRDADGRVIGGVTIGRDVTERRRLEASERRLHTETQGRQALLQLILDTLPSSVYLVQGPMPGWCWPIERQWRSGASWPHGQPMGEFLTANDIRIVDMDGHQLAPEQFATMRALQRGETVLGHQEIIRRADGTSLPVLVNAVALGIQPLIMSSTDEPAHAAGAPGADAIVVHQDVTALKEAEALKDEFLSLVTHELRQPVGLLSWAGRDLAPGRARWHGTAHLLAAGSAARD